MKQIGTLIEDVTIHVRTTRELLILLIVQVGVIVTISNCILRSPETTLRISIIKFNLNNRGWRGCGGLYSVFAELIFFFRVEKVFQAI